jgi:hypothetical protein
MEKIFLFNAEPLCNEEIGCRDLLVGEYGEGENLYNRRKEEGSHDENRRQAEHC